MNYIEKVHIENKILIKDHSITLGSRWALKDIMIATSQVPAFVKITLIHPLYGWIKVNNKDTNVPQKASNFLKLYKPVSG